MPLDDATPLEVLPPDVLPLDVAAPPLEVAPLDEARPLEDAKPLEDARPLLDVAALEVEPLDVAPLEAMLPVADADPSVSDPEEVLELEQATVAPMPRTTTTWKSFFVEFKDCIVLSYDRGIAPATACEARRCAA